MGSPDSAGDRLGRGDTLAVEPSETDHAAGCGSTHAAELVGEKVTVLWWKDGSGEVRAITRGNQLTLPARSEEPLRSGQSAWVLDAVDSTLTITPWGQVDS